jgi:hypothetical protein
MDDAAFSIRQYVAALDRDSYDDLMFAKLEGATIVASVFPNLNASRANLQALYPLFVAPLP